jgi:hypothetical protein
MQALGYGSLSFIIHVRLLPFYRRDVVKEDNWMARFMSDTNSFFWCTIIYRSSTESKHLFFIFYLESMAWIGNENTQLQNCTYCLRCDKIIRPGTADRCHTREHLKVKQFLFFMLDCFLCRLFVGIKCEHGLTINMIQLDVHCTIIFLLIRTFLNFWIL